MEWWRRPHNPRGRSTGNGKRHGGRRFPAAACLLALAALAASSWSCGPSESPAGSDPPDDLPGEPPGDPPSAAAPIDSISFDWSTHLRLAPGSDNWPMTWADDGHQYTSWGDGGGFGGTNTAHRVSLGVARVEGGPDDFRGRNVWGAPGNSEAAANVAGKSYGILALRDTLYLWVSPGSNTDNWRNARLYRSEDRGRSWHPTEVALAGGLDSLGVPAFLQQGRGHRDARDGYVYVYATGIQDLEQWEVQKPGKIFLLRVAEDSVTRAAAYRYFAGTDAAGVPLWSSERSERRPVFEDPAGVMRNSVTYVPPLERYVLITNHTARNEGNIAVFDAPDPWGPWNEILYERAWGGENATPNTFYWTLAPAWFGPDGLDFVMVFTGKTENDSWNSVEGRFHLR